MRISARLFVPSLSFLLCGPGVAQEPQAPVEPAEEAAIPDSAPDAEPEELAMPAPMPLGLFEGLTWREIGPYRGGRSCAVTGIVGDRDTYYFGAAGGGVFKTEDAGESWESISDGTFGGSIGAVAVAPSKSSVVWVGEGEKTVRGNVSSGHGIWKSTDSGESFEFMGLAETRHITRIRVHPEDPDTVWVAALGHLSGPNPERGVFKTTDGGATWSKVLFVSEEAGAVDLVVQPDDPDVLWASTWKVLRTPWSLESGGEGSALWRSKDGGDTWEEVSNAQGFARGTLGIIGVTVSPADPQRVWAMVEAKRGGLYRSDDGGETWERINKDRSLRQRAWYYTRVFADPEDEDTVWVLNVGAHKSTDGGETFRRVRTPHSDNHALWIDPRDTDRIIEANDGGANVSEDGGRTWTTQSNQSTAQFYRVTTDNHQPYRIYGAQQDNSAIRILSQSRSGSIGRDDWESTAGGESGHLAPHPDDPEIVYGGSYGGYLTRVNHRTGARRAVDVYPNDPMGAGAEAWKYRFQWNFPIFFSPHDSNRLYAAANVLFRTEDEGQSWKAISPDLTRDDSEKQRSSGGPITQDNTSVEYFCTIFAALESPHEAGVIWCGSDDGLVHLTRDDGETWANVTPPALPEWSQINCVEAHPTEPGGLYFAATRYKLDDFTPSLWRTLDYGATWTRIDAGIDPLHFTRAIRADHGRPGLLFAGTERGLYVSFDDGSAWQPMQLDLPITPVTDLAIRNDELIAATQGRGFWVFDDLALLRGFDAEFADRPITVLPPRPAQRGLRSTDEPGNAGRNPEGGAVVRFKIEDPDAYSRAIVEFFDPRGTLVKTFDTEHGVEDPEALEEEDDEDEEDSEDEIDETEPTIESLALEEGMQSVAWNLRYPGARRVDGMILWAGNGRGPTAAPGAGYTARLQFFAADGGENPVVDETVPFRVVRHPATTASEADLVAQFEFLTDTRDLLTRIHDGILDLRAIRDQVDGVLDRAEDQERFAEVHVVGERLKEQLTTVEETLYQTKNRSAQDPLNYPVRLNDKLSSVARKAGMGNWRPTAQAVAVRDELAAAAEDQLAQLKKLLGEPLVEFNRLATETGVPHVAPRSGK